MTTFTDEIDETFGVYDAYGDGPYTDAAYGWSLSETINISQPGNYFAFLIRKTISEYVKIATLPSVQWSLATTARDTLRLHVALLKIYDSVTVSENFTVAPALSFYAYALREIDEVISLDGLVYAGFNWGVTLPETIKLIEDAKATYGALVSETIDISATASAVKHWLVMEAFHIIDAVNAKGTYHRSLSDAIVIADAVARFLGASIAEVMAIVDTATRRRLVTPTLTQNVQITDTVSRALLVQAVASDAIEITHDQVLKMIFKPVIDETIMLTAMHIEPSGSVTAWAINVQNNAVSEYTNFDFNSFATNGVKYLGANENGLYELEGATDDGQQIIAKMRSGIMQFMQSHSGSVKGAYLGLRGGGDWYLKIIADDKTYIYKVTAKDMKTTKVEIGKGIRARYFSFELTSTGQEFDLDSIEFLPIVNQRRV